MEGDLPQDELLDETQQNEEEHSQHEEAGFAEAFGEVAVDTTDTDAGAQADAGGEAAQVNSQAEQHVEQPGSEKTAAELVEDLQDAGYTPEQIRQALDGHTADLRKVHGRYGELNSLVQGLQQQLVALNAQGKSGQGARLTKESLKRLSEEYPEIAEILAEDLSDALGSAGSGGLDAEAVKALLEAHTQESLKPTLDGLGSVVDQRVAQGVLSYQHPDWTTVREEPEFKEWVGKLPADKQEEFLNTWSPTVVGQYLTEFKASRAEKTQQQTTRQNRLANAETPTRGGAKDVKSGAQTEEDGFNSAFNA